MNIHVHNKDLFTSLIISSEKKKPIAKVPLRKALLFYPSTKSNMSMVFFLSPH